MYSNRLLRWFLLTIKSTNIEQTKLKARYMVGVHLDRHKRMMVHSANTMQSLWVRMFL